MNFQSRDHLAHSKLSQLPWGNDVEKPKTDWFTPAMWVVYVACPVIAFAFMKGWI